MRKKDLLKSWEFDGATTKEARLRSSLIHIGDICVGYDGYHTSSSLKKLIDEIKAIAYNTVNVLEDSI